MSRFIGFGGQPGRFLVASACLAVSVSVSAAGRSAQEQTPAPPTKGMLGVLDARGAGAVYAFVDENELDQVLRAASGDGKESYGALMIKLVVQGRALSLDPGTKVR